MLSETLEGFGLPVAQCGYDLLVQNLQIPSLQVIREVALAGVTPSDLADARLTALAPHGVSELGQLGSPELLVVQVDFLPHKLEFHQQVLAPCV